MLWSYKLGVNMSDNNTLLNLGIARILLGQRLLREYSRREDVPPKAITTYDHLSAILNEASGTGYRGVFSYLWTHREIFKDFWMRNGLWKVNDL